MTILLLNGYVGDQTFDFSGVSGKEYKFVWDKAEGVYKFRPANQDDANDIFRQNGPVWQISAMTDGENNDAAVTSGGYKAAPKTALPTRYFRDLDADELAEMARSNGIAAAHENYGKPRLIELLEAYFLGVGMLREQPKRAAEMVATLATTPQSVLTASIATAAPVSITAADIPIAVRPDEGKTTEQVAAEDRAANVASLNAVRATAPNLNQHPEISEATGKPKRKYVRNPRGVLATA